MTRRFRLLRLLLQRFCELAVTGIKLIEQPHVFDCDDGLVREGLQKRNLFVRERMNLRAADDNSPMEFPLEATA